MIGTKFAIDIARDDNCVGITIWENGRGVYKTIIPHEESRFISL